MDLTAAGPRAAPTVPLASLAARLDAAGLYGVFARHLLRLSPQLPVPVEGEVFAVGGPMHGRFEVGFAWCVGDDAGALTRLLRRIAGHGELRAYVELAQLEALVSALPHTRTSHDVLLVASGRRAPPATARVIAVDADVDRSCIDPEIARRLPPPHIWSRFGFAYHGLLVDDRVVAVLETTVDDGEHVAVQQVFTASSMRGRGCGHALLTSVVEAQRRRGRTPIYVCAAENAASIALARSAGFEPQLRLGLVEAG